MLAIRRLSLLRTGRSQLFVPASKVWDQYLDHSTHLRPLPLTPLRPSAPFRPFFSTNLLFKANLTRNIPNEEQVKEDEQPSRVVDNYNTNNLPSGVTWSFSGNSAADAALTTVVGLVLGQEMPF
jgi:hypothetical protein